MKILFCRWKSICEVGITNAINRLGYDLVTFDRKPTSHDYDVDYLKALAEFIQSIKGGIDCVFSVNYQPIIARTCKVFKLPYISWTVDCPDFRLYSKTISLPTNRIFVLDRMQYEKFAPLNPDNIFHMPMGCDIDTWDSINVTPEEHKKYDCDISFVGSLYSEKCEYNSIKDNLSDYIRGYVDGLINAQINVYGYNFIEDSLTDEFAAEFKKQVNWGLGEDYIEDIKGIIADEFIGEKCTEQERIRTLNAISERFNMDLWTQSDASMLPKINVRGSADSDRTMPKIFKCSKINLNMTNRPFKTGMPLRIFDLMGAGGFVISNYQAEIPEHFIPGEDIVLYESIPDLLDKIAYYLEHDEERKQIAKNGHDKVKNFHSYDIRLQEIFRMCGFQL